MVGDMKKYEPQKLIAISRYQKCFPKLDEDLKNDIYRRMEELIEEEREYCDQGNYKHMTQILSSIAIYETLMKHGRSKEEAYQYVSEEMWNFLDPSAMQKLAKRKFFLPLMKKIVPSVLSTDREPAGNIHGILMIRKMNFILNAMNAFMQRYWEEGIF